MPHKIITIDRARAGRRRRRYRTLAVGVAIGALIGLIVIAKLSLPPMTLPALFASRNQPSVAYFATCADAHAAGVYSIPRGAPGYRPALDADNDGLACEPYLGR